MRFYSVQLRRVIEVSDDQVEFITLTNGRRAAKTTVTVSDKETQLFKILSREEAARLTPESTQTESSE